MRIAEAAEACEKCESILAIKIASYGSDTKEDDL